MDLTRGRAWAPGRVQVSDSGDWTLGRDLLYACPPEEEVRDSGSAESEAARMYSRCAATAAARAGRPPIPNRNVGEASRVAPDAR